MHCTLVLLKQIKCIYCNNTPYSDDMNDKVNDGIAFGGHYSLINHKLHLVK